MKISILFYGKKKVKTFDRSLPIYLRVTIHGLRFETTTHRFVDPDKWSAQAGRVKGNSEEARCVNQHLDHLRQRAFGVERAILAEGSFLNISSFREKWLGPAESARMLIPIFRKHNEQMEKLIGVDFRKGTLDRYKTSLQHTESFLKWKFKAVDIDIRKISYQFVTDYEFWLKTVRHCDHNTTLKYLNNFKKIINICLKNGWLTRDPFIGFKRTKKEVTKEYLTKEELSRIAECLCIASRIEMVRDIFLFSCYTGLAYADVKKLSHSEIVIGIDGERWIFTNRQKTESLSRIPLLPPALEIIDKYRDYPAKKTSDLILPVLSNQKMNAYLKEIADLCGIKKNLTYHTARHTFATTVTLSNGIPMETVSKMLGHRNIKTTQQYAKIVDQKLSDDMRGLKEKMRAKTGPI